MPARFSVVQRSTSSQDMEDAEYTETRLPCLFLALVSGVLEGLALTACRFTSSVPTGNNRSALRKRSVGAQGFISPWPNSKVSFLNLMRNSPFHTFCTLLLLTDILDNPDNLKQ